MIVLYPLCYKSATRKFNDSSLNKWQEKKKNHWVFFSFFFIPSCPGYKVDKELLKGIFSQLFVVKALRLKFQVLFYVADDVLSLI